MNGIQQAKQTIGMSMAGAQQQAGAAKTVDSSPIAEATILIDKEMSCLCEVISVLESRLASVLTEPQPIAAGPEEKKDMRKSPLLVFMDDTKTTIQSRRCEIERLLERLQI